MAKQNVNIGVEGNDGTGDSIRESFRKVNENFTELYAVFGVGGQINFTTLSDTPDELSPSTVALVNPAGTQVTLSTLASNSALPVSDDDYQSVDTIKFSYGVDGKLIITNSFKELANDTSPALGGPLYAGGFGIASPGISTAAANAVNAAHGAVSGLTIDDLVITKGYADQRYITSGLPLRVADEPSGRLHYTWTINGYTDDNAIEILQHYNVDQTLDNTGHGFESGANGTAVVFQAEDSDPTNLTSGTTYYIRFVTSTKLYLYTEANKQYAITDNNTDAENNKVLMSGTIAGDDTHTIVDAGLNTSLAGNFLSDSAVPRFSAVRRQGDTMTGELYLNDHPGELSGQGAPNGEEDLQAATKFYVDNTAYSSPEVLFVSTKGDDTMSDVPPGKEGTSFTYAFRTVNAAAQRAETLIRSAPVEPGNYMQTLTHSSFTKDAVVMNAEVDNPAFGQARSLLDNNRDFIAKEVVGFINFNFPDFAYNQATCERDTGLIIDAVSLDINRGLNANYLTRQAAERYYSSVSGRIAITTQKTETKAGITKAKEIARAVLTNDLLDQKTISTITKGAITSLTTTTAHGLSNKNIILVRNVGGSLGPTFNDLKFYAKVISSDTIELYTDVALATPFDTSAIVPSYTSGGIIGTRYQIGEDQVFAAGSVEISAATKTNPIRITTSIDHALVDQAEITISGVNGMTELNGNTYFVDRISNTQVDLYTDSALTASVDGTGFTTYVDSGAITKSTDADISAVTAVADKFDLVNTIIDGGIEAGADIVYGSTYKIVATNGSSSYADQTNPTNTDVLPGKVIRGKRSEAIGQIVSFTNNDTSNAGTDPVTNGSEPNPTSFQVHLLSAKDFEVGEPLEYGNFVKRKQVTIMIESGIYEEDFPIRLESNVSLKGDEFRRVIIKPKTETDSRIPRVSQSKWAQLYFYRDNEFDGLTLATEGTPFRNQDNIFQGRFGFHYLNRAGRPINLGNTVTNVGDYNNASAIVLANKDYIVEETIQFLTDRFPALVYSREKCRRDTKLVIDALVNDLAIGGEEKTLEVQGSYHRLLSTGDYLTQLGDSTQEVATEAAIGNISALCSSLLVGNAPTYTDGSYTAGSASVLAIETPVTTLGSGESGTVTIVGNLIDKINFVFDVEYNPPKRNDQVDLFLMGDATIIRNVTCQGHGGFMCVLDPEGQVLTKSPYIQTASSFSKSTNKQTFAGGMYVDAYVGNLPTNITAKVDNFTLDVRSNLGEGLRLRAPQLPCPFYVEGRRYQVNAISDYDKGQGTARLYLDANSNDGTGYDETQFGDGLAIRSIFLQTAGNRSLLANDFTQVNDLGYGLIANNAAFSEQVSTFTYYCHTAMYANNGSEIRGLNCSNGYGNFGLVAEGADPNEIPDQVTLRDDMIQPAKVYTDSTYTNAFDTASITLYDMATPPTSSSVVTIDHGGSVGVLQYKISAVSSLSDADGDGVIGEAGDVVVTGVRALDNASLAGTTAVVNEYTGVATSGAASGGTGLVLGVNVTGVGAIGGSGSATISIENVGSGYATTDTVTISGADIGGTSPTNDLTIDVSTIFGNTAGTVSNEVYKLDIVADDVSVSDFFGTLRDTVTLNTIVEFRHNFNHIFAGVKDPTDLVTRPSTAVNFDESDNATYRSIAFATADSFSQSLGANEVLTTFEAEYDFVQMDVSVANLTGGYGSTQGDSKLAIAPLTTGGASIYTDAYRISADGDNLGDGILTPGDAGYGDGMRFVWDGKTHKITNYEVVTVIVLPSPVSATAGATVTQGSVTGTLLETVSGSTTIEVKDVSGGAFSTGAGAVSIAATPSGTPSTVNVNNWAFIEFGDVAGTNINSSYSGSGLNSAVASAARQIPAGLKTGTTAEITISISLLRATGHDFTQIGTGSFNDSNYPNVILGQPVNSLADFYTDSDTATNSQVWERRKGRVFFVSTDQDGFFRVGKFFSVDQATGDITFAGEIGLSNANSLGFKKGVTINEFSADDSFADESGQAVPTEKAAGNFINRVLGYNVRSLAQILGSANRIGPGFLPLNGDSPMEGDMDMGNFNIQNVSNPTSGTDATNKNYVDQNINTFSVVRDLRDVSFLSPVSDDIAVFTGKKVIYIDNETGSGAPFQNGDTFEAQNSGATGTIVARQTVTDAQFGSIVKIVYTENSGTIVMDNEGTNTIACTTIGRTVTASPVTSALVSNVGGPFDEIANATETASSDINITVSRTSSDATIDLAIEADSIINADVNSAAAISQSKLNMNIADTASAAPGSPDQSVLGVARFNSVQFNATNGWIEIKDSTGGSDGVAAAKLTHIATDTVLGRSAAGTGAVSAISFDTVLDEGGALRDGEFGAYSSGTDVLLRTAASTYSTKTLADIGTADTIVLRKTATSGVAGGAIQAEAIILGGNDQYEVLSLNSTTLQVKTPGQATVLEATGSTTTSLNVDIPGLINVGKSYVDPSAASPVLVTAESTAQTNSGLPASGGRRGKGFIATNWTYTKAIEAIDEGANGGANSTGITLGANVGFTEAGDNIIILFADGTAQVRVSTSGIETDTLSSLSTDTDLTITANGTGAVYVNDTLKISGNIAKGTGTITVPTNTTGTMAIGVSDTTTTTQGDLNLDFSLSGTGAVSATGDAHGLGTADSPSFAGLTMTGNILPDNTSNNRNIGSSSQKFNTVYASVFDGTATSAQYADLAENYLADADYEFGTVLVFGGEHEVTTTTNKANAKVAGVVSENPAYLMNSTLDGEFVSAIALQGRTACKVIGRVEKGDMIVTSSIPGYGMVDHSPGVGTVIGKAVGEKLDDGHGIVEVVVGRV